MEGQLFVHVAAFGAAIGGTALATPIVRRVAIRLGWLDRPHGHKTHDAPVPLLGGVAVYIGLVLGALVAHTLDPRLFFDQEFELFAALAGGLVVLALGTVDDMRDLGPLPKLLIQTGAAIPLAIACGGLPFLSNPFGGEPLALGFLSIPIAVLWIVGLTNALNLIDGLDGLAVGVATICATTLLLNIWPETGIYSILAVTLFGASLAFLRFNFPPARIFLGDGGAFVLGFALAAASLGGFRKGTTLVTLLVPLVALGLPILNTALALARGIRLRRSPLRAHRDHLHDRLVRIGLAPRAAVLLLYAITGYLGGVALALRDVTPDLVLRFAFVAAGAAIIGLRALVFVERRLLQSRNEAASATGEPGDGSGDVGEPLLVLCEAQGLAREGFSPALALGDPGTLGRLFPIDDQRVAILLSREHAESRQPEDAVRRWIALSQPRQTWRVQTLAGTKIGSTDASARPARRRRPGTPAGNAWREPSRGVNP